MKNTLDRRTVLRGAAGVAISLPFLEAMRPSKASAAVAPPKRFLAYFLGIGTIASRWPPTGTETDFKLSSILAPLEPYKADLNILANLRRGGYAYGHWNNWAFLGGSQGTKGDDHAIAATLDQLIAQRWKGKTKIGSLELGVAVPPNNNHNQSVMSWAGLRQPVFPDNNPYSLYKRLFGGFVPGSSSPSSAAEILRIRAQRKSVIDYARQSAVRLQMQLGTDDKARLESYLTSVREIETQFDKGNDPSIAAATCSLPSQGATPIAYNDNRNVPALIRLQTDLAVAALACDLTRVVTIMTDMSGSDRSHTWCDASGGFHGLSHTGRAEDMEKIVRINTWWNQQFAYLLTRLKSVADADGTRLLDNSLVMQVPEYGPNVPDKDSHEHGRLPIVLAGKCGGAFKTGRFLSYPTGTAVNQLFVSVLQALGFSDETFGNPAPVPLVKGPLPRL